MSEDEAYEKLQEFLGLAEELVASGRYSAEEIKDELETRLD